MEINSEEHFVKFLESAGFEIRELEGEHWYCSDKSCEMDDKRLVYQEIKEDKNEVEYGMGCGEKGYSHFFATFVFDRDTGDFKEHCIGE